MSAFHSHILSHLEFPTDLLKMQPLIFTFSALLLRAQTVSGGYLASQPPTYHHVPHQRAPSYYPGHPWNFPNVHTRPNVCAVVPPADGSDAAPAIVEAFERCGHNGKVVFENTTYNVDSVMNITGLSNVEVDLKGTLLWGTNISYWLNHSLPVGYQNQSSAFFFGGDNIYFHGNGYGTFDGNGQDWYDYVGDASNYPRRPHQITFSGLTNSVIEGIRFVQSQMWTMTLIHSENVLLQDIYVNSTNLKGGTDQNTDGADVCLRLDAIEKHADDIPDYI